MGITSREMVFGKRLPEYSASLQKRGKLLEQSSASQEGRATSSSVFGNINTKPFDSKTSIGFNVTSSASGDHHGASVFTSPLQTNPSLFSFGAASDEGTSSTIFRETDTGSETSTMFSFDANRPGKVFQAPTESLGGNPSQGTPTNTATSSSSFSSFTFSRNQPQTTSHFGTTSKKTSPSEISFQSLPAVESGFNLPAFPSSSTETDPVNKQEKAATSIGFPVTPIATSSQPTSVFGSKFGHSGFGFSKVKQATVSPQKQNQPSFSSTNVFGKGLGQPVTSNKSTSILPKKNEKSPEEKARMADISMLKVLVIREIPEPFNKNAWLKRFYSRFGEVVKVLCNPPKKSATITFKTHVSLLDIN
jgi:hypothetical protein